MAAVLSHDIYAAGSHLSMVEHLCGPFAAGAVDSSIAISAAGRIEIASATRESVLLIAPRAALGDRRLRVALTLDPEGAATALPALEFAAYTESAAYLPAHAPAVEAKTRMAAPFALALAVSFVDRDGNPVVAAVPDVGALLEARLLEGSLGKMLYVLGAEKQRLRRQMREILAMHELEAARWDVLDRVGADLAVPRFVDELAYDAAADEIVATTRAGGEPDADYRRRLALYRGWNMPTRAAVTETLNGPGGPGDANAGPLGELGLSHRFSIEERNNPFAVAVHLVASPDAAGTAARANFFAHVASTRLIWPAEFTANDPHAARLLSVAQRSDLEALRRTLRAGGNWTQTLAVAPALAEALARVARVVALLSPTPAPRLDLQRAFDPAAGSRYELGLGVDIAPLTAAVIDALHAAYTTPGFIDALPPAEAALLSGLVSRPAAEDPLGAWLFAHCGLATVHQTGGSAIYLSTLPTFGLMVNESAVQPGGDVLALEALHQAPGDPGVNVALEAGLGATLAEWAADGEVAMTRLSRAQLEARFDLDVPQPAAARDVLLAAGLPAPTSLPALAPALARVPAELVAGVEIAPALAAQIAAGTPAAVAKLRKLAELLRRHHVSSALPLFTATNQLTLLVAAIGLPEAGINLSERRTSGFRWYAVPIEGPAGVVSPVGARAQWRRSGATLTAIVVIGYARRGLVDPYEYRVDLPEGATLDLTQYEFLMNTLERLYPLGVQVNTFAIRRQHVELEAGAGARPLPPAIMRTYRKFQRRHRRGETSVGLPTESTSP